MLTALLYDVASQSCLPVGMECIRGVFALTILVYLLSGMLQFVCAVQLPGVLRSLSRACVVSWTFFPRGLSDRGSEA